VKHKKDGPFHYKTTTIKRTLEEHVIYSNFKTDIHGNWIYRIATSSDGSKKTETRTITYWDENNNKKVTTKKQSAQIKSVKVDYNVYENGVKGMNIKVSFDVQGMKGQTGLVAAYFYFKNGDKLKDYNNYCHTGDGAVATHKNYKPEWDNTTYTDFNIFMPYDELHLANGHFDLKMKIKVWGNKQENAEGRQSLTTSDWAYFTFTK